MTWLLRLELHFRRWQLHHAVERYRRVQDKTLTYEQVFRHWLHMKVLEDTIEELEWFVGKDASERGILVSPSPHQEAGQ